jgi:hypothetical protein
MATTVHYRGIRRDGVGVGGQLSDPLANWVEARFKAGWRKLTVTYNGEQVGGIAPHPDTGRRIWWADADINRDGARSDG